MNLNQLRYVLAISEHQSFSKAAHGLYITQPTLSQQILALEEELGVRLFVRQPRTVTLTPAGEEFLLYARRILNETENLTLAMKSHGSLVKGRLKIGALWVFGYVGIAEAVAAFREAYPTIDVTLMVDGSSRLLEMLLTRELDAIFIIVSPLVQENLDELYPDVEFHPILQSDMSMVLPTGHPLAQQERIHFKDLDRQKIIHVSRESALHGVIQQSIQIAGVHPEVVGECSQSEISIQLAASGIGMSFVSTPIAQALKNDRVQVRPLDPPILRTIDYVTLKSTQVIPAVEVFTRYIRENRARFFDSIPFESPSI